MMYCLVFAGFCLALATAVPTEKILVRTGPDTSPVEREIEVNEILDHLMERGNEQGMSSRQKQTILDAHNNQRRKVSPKAANMMKMQWDSDLARTAQNYANKCIWAHNAKRSAESSFSYVGENLYLTTGTPTLNKPVEAWYNEQQNYKFYDKKCQPGKACGHYTQVVWHDSTHLGCGMKRCGSLRGLSGWNNALIVVCNYGPGGNYRNVRPYTAGPACSQCPRGNVCDNGLCSSGQSSPSECECRK